MEGQTDGQAAVWWLLGHRAVLDKGHLGFSWKSQVRRIPALLAFTLGRLLSLQNVDELCQTGWARLCSPGAPGIWASGLADSEGPVPSASFSKAKPRSEPTLSPLHLGSHTPLRPPPAPVPQPVKSSTLTRPEPLPCLSLPAWKPQPRSHYSPTPPLLPPSHRGFPRRQRLLETVSDKPSLQGQSPPDPLASRT